MSDLKDTFERLIRDPSVWAEVRANQAKLNACLRHTISPDPRKLGERVTCIHCGGMMSVTDMSMYVKGYEAAGGDCDDIWPGFRAEKHLPA